MRVLRLRRLLFCLVPLVLLLAVAAFAAFVAPALCASLNFVETASRIGGVLSLLSVLLALGIVAFSLVAVLCARRAAGADG